MTICLKKNQGAITCANGPGSTYKRGNTCQAIKLNSKFWDGSRFRIAGPGVHPILQTIALGSLLAHENLHTTQGFTLKNGSNPAVGIDAANDKALAQGEIDTTERGIQVIIENGQQDDLSDYIKVIIDYKNSFRARAQ